MGEIRLWIFRKGDGLMVNHNRGNTAFFAALIFCLLSIIFVYAVSAQSSTTTAVNQTTSEYSLAALVLALAVTAAAIIVIATKKIGKPQLSIAKNVNYA
jgi:hypothetical protein